VVTNKPAAPARRIVDGLALGPVRDPGRGDSMPVRKPDPEPLLRALGHVGAEPLQALYVGDMAVDVETAPRRGKCVSSA
jgi:phosphoglycolate phosphatase-like HAD superfamily hydrolase